MQNLKLFSGVYVALQRKLWHVFVAAAMNQLTKNLCCEWGPDGVRVNAVSPWYTLTPLAQQVLQDKEYEAMVLARTPLKRVAQPDEVSGAQIILCQEISLFIIQIVNICICVTLMIKKFRNN